MKALKIQNIDALEILDSRGNPTIQVEVTLHDGTMGVACVPSGASTGQHEAVELRDHDAHRYQGMGVLHAVKNVRTILGPAIAGMEATQQADIDAMLIHTDGTPNKSKLGANAILGISMAVARAAAQSLRLPLYRYLGGSTACRLPVPMMNVINGGKHAGNRLDFQEFMIVPHGAPNFHEALRYGVETFKALKRTLEKRGLPTAVGDEGGFAPDLNSNDEACDLIVDAIEAAGFRPGTDVAIALDPAASSFFKNGNYHFASGKTLGHTALLDLYRRWVEVFPIVSIEDGFDEGDWEGFVMQTAEMGDHIQIVGDDNYVTNRKFIAEGIRQKATNAVLIKPNQIGTVTETIEAIELAHDAGWRTVVSHRSGETEDTFIADFAVAMGTGQIKTGSLCRSERVAKYNRLLRIEKELGSSAEFSSPFHVK